MLTAIQIILRSNIVKKKTSLLKIINYNLHCSRLSLLLFLRFLKHPDRKWSFNLFRTKIMSFSGNFIRSLLGAIDCKYKRLEQKKIDRCNSKNVKYIEA